MRKSLERVLESGISFSYDDIENTHRYEIDTDCCSGFLCDSEKMREYVKRCSDAIIDNSRDENVYNDFVLSFSGENVCEYIGVLDGIIDLANSKKNKLNEISDCVQGYVVLGGMIFGALIGGICGYIDKQIGAEFGLRVGGFIGLGFSLPLSGLTPNISSVLGDVFSPLIRKRDYYKKLYNCIDEEGMQVYSELEDSLEDEDEEDY